MRPPTRAIAVHSSGPRVAACFLALTLALATMSARGAEAPTLESLIADFNQRYSVEARVPQTSEDMAAASAERKLEAIKQALVDLALDTDLRLDSAAFLDSLGVLHE
ncbi:MAG: hypothetical protein ACPHVT_03300, partial [Porticoccaceae bacterium]